VTVLANIKEVISEQKIQLHKVAGEVGRAKGNVGDMVKENFANEMAETEQEDWEFLEDASTDAVKSMAELQRACNTFLQNPEGSAIE
jgi:hypothetical protein